MDLVFCFNIYLHHVNFQICYILKLVNNLTNILDFYAVNSSQTQWKIKILSSLRKKSYKTDLIFFINNLPHI